MYEAEALQTVTGPTIRPGGLGLTELALAGCSLPEQAWVVDVACGTGATVQHLRQQHRYRAVGVDLSRRLLASGRQRCPELPLVSGQATCLPLAAAQAQAVFMECSLSILPEPQAVLAEVERVLCPAGWLILSDLYLRQPSAMAALRQLPAPAPLQNAMSQAELYTHLQHHGFEIVTWQDCSQELQKLTARLIQACGSLQAGWQHGLPGGLDALDTYLAVQRCRPGYYLLTARKFFR